MKKLNLFFLGAILLIAVFLRFFQIGINPPSLTWDEAAWGYNAYSIGIDGKDEFGKIPITYLESFGDFKPPVYAYLDVIPVKILGLNEFATRLPSAFFGVLTVLMSYFLVRQIFYKSRSSESIALISAFILAISPWHIMLSRAAFEANVSTFFIVTGVTAFLASVQRNKWFLIISAVSFGLSIYTFNTARVFCPILALILAFAFRKQLIANIKTTLIAGLLGLLVVLPAIPFLLSQQAGLRFAEVNIFTDANVVKVANQEVKNDGNSAESKIIHNRRVGYGLLFLQHYFDNLSPNFLFITGDGNPKFSVQNVGELYLFEIPLMISGIFFLFKKKEGNWWLVPVWIITGIIPAATARETPHALRIETTIPMFQVLSAYGGYYLYEQVSSIKYKVFSIKTGSIMCVLFVIFGLFNFLYFMHSLFYTYPYLYSSEWQYGYKDAVNYIQSTKDKYNDVIFTEDLGRPYIYALFYEKYDPAKFRFEANVTREALGFVHVNSFDHIKFVKDVSSNINSKENNLYIDTPKSVPENAKIVRRFEYLDGSVALVAYKL